MPIIVLAGADAEADVVRGLDAQADGYVANPVRPGELLARLRARLRASGASANVAFAVVWFAELLTERAP